MRERRADPEDIEAAFRSPQAALRCLAAESCTWQGQPDCETRLEAMVREDPSVEVRHCSLRTLGALCSDAAREALLRLQPIFRREGRAIFVEVAGACSSADLYLVLAQEPGPLPQGLAPPPTELAAELRWLQGIAALPTPRYRAVQAREMAEQKLHFARTEAVRIREIRTLRDQAEEALAAGRWQAALETARTLALLGEPVGDLLRGVHLQRLQAQRDAFEQALEQQDFRLAVSNLDPHLLRLDPDLFDRLDRKRYQATLPAAREIVRLAEQNKTAAAQRKLDDLPTWEYGPHPINDLVLMQTEAALKSLERKRFDRAWQQAWLLRATDAPTQAIFLRSYATERWEAEGFRMDRQQFEEYMRQVEGLAPRGAVLQAERYELKDAVRQGKAQAAYALVMSYGALLNDHLGMCLGENGDRVPSPLDDYAVDAISEFLEYLAVRATTAPARSRLREKRDEGRRIAREFMSQRSRLSPLVSKMGQCLEFAQKMKRYEGARPGSEAYQILHRDTQATLRCVSEYHQMIRPYLQRGQECVRYAREAHELVVELREKWIPAD